MKPKLLLRIAAILIFVHGVLHTIGFTSWKDAADPVQKEVVQQMTGHKFPFMGAVHSLGDYYEGFGYGCSIALILISVLLWIASAENMAINRLAKQVVIATGIALLIWGTDELVYFFPFAAALTFVACICTLLSVYLAGRKGAEGV
jgi:hypothetical protein